MILKNKMNKQIKITALKIHCKLKNLIFVVIPYFSTKNILDGANSMNNKRKTIVQNKENFKPKGNSQKNPALNSIFLI